MTGCDIVWPWPIDTGRSAYATEQEAARNEPMALRLLYSVQDARRYALRSQKIGVGLYVSLNGFHHYGVFADARCVFCCRFTCNSNQRQQ